MEFAIWAYPWDLLDEGVERVADRLTGMGIDQVNLATNYHSLQAFLPHNPERRTFFAHASAYFQPGEGYGRLEPVANETMGDRDWVAEVTDGLAGTGLDVNSWTVGCHNSRLGLANPEATLTTPSNDSLAFGLCPSNPDVRDYLRAVVADLDRRDSFDRIELESFDYFHGSGFGWHHDKFHTRIGELGEFLFGLCFCDHCRAEAADDGVDVDRARRTAREAVKALAEGELPHGIDVGSWLLARPAVRAYAEARMGTLTDLHEDLAAATDADLSYYAGLLSVETAWMHGADLAALAGIVDDLTVVAYEADAAGVTDRLRTAADLASPTHTTAALRPAHPNVHDVTTAVEQVRAAAQAGVDRVSFYNYGLLPERNLEWIDRGIDAVT
jgi:hypothetical protein